MSASVLFDLAPDDHCGGTAELMAARAREERLHAELVEFAGQVLSEASAISVHHRWIEDVVDFLRCDSSEPWRYENAAMQLRFYLRRSYGRGYRLFEQEQEQVRLLAAKLTHYSHALKSVGRIESRRMCQCVGT